MLCVLELFAHVVWRCSGAIDRESSAIAATAERYDLPQFVSPAVLVHMIK